MEIRTPGIRLERSAHKRLTTKKEKEDFAKEIERRRERDSEMVTGIFENKENPGAPLRFAIKLYPGDDLVQYDLYDGERYRLPRGVARHIAQNCYIKKYNALQGVNLANGASVERGTHDGRLNAPNWMVERKVHRFGFTSLEFMNEDLDLVQSDVVTVSQ